MEDSYPERIFKIYLLNPEFMLSAVFKLFKPLVDANTLRKIAIIYEKDLPDYVDPKYILKQNGGE